MNDLTEVLGTVAMVPKGEYDSSAYYEYLNVVTYEGSTYMAKKNVNNVLPTNTEYWQFIAGGLERKDASLVFDTVADMKASEILKDGMTVQTLGYYEVNDGGGATYKITDTASLTDYQETCGDLYATLIIEDEANVKQFGAYGDGTHDDTSKINESLSYFNNIYIPEGTYMINGGTSLLPKSNTKIHLSNDTVLKVIPNELETYRIINIMDINNLELFGGTLQGDKDSHLGLTGEGGHCIGIYRSSNIFIHNITLKNGWGDGLYISSGNNINTQNIICDSNRRNGLSLIAANGYTSVNDKFINTNGTSPQAGVDIEPNTVESDLSNIKFLNPYTYNNSGNGFTVSLRNRDATKGVNILVENLLDIGSDSGLGVHKSKDCDGEIIIDNPILKNNTYAGIQLRECYDSACLLEINNPKIINCNTSEGTGAKYSSSITCYTENEDTNNGSIGGFTINNPYSTNKGNQKALYIDHYDNTLGSTNIKYNNPINKGGNIDIRDGKTNIIFNDENNQYETSFNSSYEISSQNLSKTYNGDTLSANRTLTLDENIPTGISYKFINTSQTKKILITLENCYCYKFSTDPGITIELPSYNDMIELVKVTSTEWRVNKIIGGPILHTT